MRNDEEVTLTLVLRGLHDLSQPLTAMQCRLWLGTVEDQSLASLSTAVQESLTECERIIAIVRAMQDQVTQAMNQGVK